MDKHAHPADPRTGIQPFPDYPGNARSFVHLDSRLLPYWHTLFDVCPALLKLDPPDGTRIFREFMTWAYWRHITLNWSFHLQVCRWLLESEYRKEINEEHIEALMIASAARWVATDDSQAVGVVLAWQESPLPVFDWKSNGQAPLHPVAAEQEELPPTPWDFAWCPLGARSGNSFRRWLRV